MHASLIGSSALVVAGLSIMGRSGSEEPASPTESNMALEYDQDETDEDGSVDEDSSVRAYKLLGHRVEIKEGDAVLWNTGWRTWAGAWLLAKHLESKRAPTFPGATWRVLDLSCGTGLAGIALARAGHEVVLCDLEPNVPTIRENLVRNLKGAVGAKTSSASIVAYAWGAKLPDVMRPSFDIVLCGDLLYHVWNDRLQVEFLVTLQELRQRGGVEQPLFLFGGQVRSSRQERLVLACIARRLGLVQEEISIDASADGSPLVAQAKYRMVQLRPLRPGEKLEES